MLVKHPPTTDSGNGWKVSKLHEIKHNIFFTAASGALRCYNASHPEDYHKAHAKRPGQQACKNLDIIDQRCGNGIADSIVIDTMAALFKKEGVHTTLNKQL